MSARTKTASTNPFETLPGEQAQVDWGHFGSIVVEGCHVQALCICVHPQDPLEGFDFSFQTSVSKQNILNLATLDFVRKRENLILLGPPGVGSRT